MAWLLLAAAVGGAVFWHWWQNRDEARIRRTLTELFRTVDKPRGEPPGAGVLKAAGLDKFFAPELHFSSEDPPFQRDCTPAELKTPFIQARDACTEITVNFELLDLRIDGETAEAEFNIAVFGAERGPGGDFSGLRRGNARLKRSDGKWKISGLQLTAPLSP